MMQQLWAKLTDHLDPFLFAIVTAIAALGLLVLFSAANETMGRVVSQSQKVVIAVAIMILIANLSPQFIGRYLARVGDKALSSVGAYQIEGEGIQLFERIEGDHFTIVGLPLLPLLKALRDQGAIDG